MAKKRYFEIKLSRTDNEWDVLAEKIKTFNKKDNVSSYIKRKIIRLVKDFNDCPDCITDLVTQKRTSKSIYLEDTELIKGLKEISEKTNTPIATIIDRGIIQTYLIEKA